MKTLIATLIALGTLAGTANAQHVRFIGHGYGHGPAYCAPGTVHVQPQVSVAPVAVAPVQQAEAPVEAPAEAAPEAPADNAAPLQAPLPPK
jgi:hypothetical protein